MDQNLQARKWLCLLMTWICQKLILMEPNNH